MDTLNSSDSAQSQPLAIITAPAASDRRRKARLRDLCDEVLASFRVASNRDPISDLDRVAALEILPRVTGLAR
jgi:hypothetical protein